MAAADRARAIIIDAGNTRTRAVLWCGGRQRPAFTGAGRRPVAEPLTELGVVPTPRAATGTASYVDALEALVAGHAALPRVLTSVSPLARAALGTAWPSLHTVSHHWRLPFVLDVAVPAQTGTDRLCNVAAAAAAGLREALVVDAGTATTFDVLRGGRFIGGLIAPGMALAAACLAERTAQLPPVPFAACPLAPGRDTAAAMGAGAFHVGTLGVSAVITRLEAAEGGPPVILTGGLGHHLATPDRPWDPDWTLRGAALLALAQDFPDLIATT